MCDSRELGIPSNGFNSYNSNRDSPLSMSGQILARPRPLHHPSIANGAVGEVDHIQLLSNQFQSLLKCQDNTDVTFIVEKKPYRAHRVILSARCEYFRALLYGGMKESFTTEEIPLPDTPAFAFETLLRYIYTGNLSLKELKEEDLLDLLCLAHKYGLLSLESAIASYLKAIINIHNVTTIYDVSCLYHLYDLQKTCLTYMDHNAVEVSSTEGFAGLSRASLLYIISQDSFCAPEIQIFRAVQSWIKANDGEEVNNILNAVRLSLISLNDLFHEVRESKLYTADVILDAIQCKTECRVNDMEFRGHLVEDENLAQYCHGADVISGEMKENFLDNNSSNIDLYYDLERGFSRHLILEGDPGIIIQLGRPSIINTIKLLLWDKDSRCYSYKLECSMDSHEWTTLVDYSKSFCRSYQTIHFEARVVRYIRILGTHNTQNRCFHLVSFECLNSTRICSFQSGYIVPIENVASVAASASVVEGVSRNRNALIDGNIDNYDWESGYTCHQIGSGCITIQLAQPFIIGSMRMLLWDCDDRIYGYYIEVSLDQVEWTMVCDRREEQCRGWQIIIFAKRPVSFIKIVGSDNTANEVFHVVHFECPAVSNDVNSSEQDSDSQTTGSVTDRDVEDI